MMVKLGCTSSQQMADHTLIDVPLANVYLHFQYYSAHCRVMCISTLVYPLIIGIMHGAWQIFPDPDWNAEEQLGFEPGPVWTTTITMMITVEICLQYRF